MAAISITPTHVEVRFSTAEKVGGLVRDQVIPRNSIASVDLVDDGYAATEGVRAPGLGVPGRRKVGTWRSKGTRHLVSVRRGQPAVRIALTGQRYDTMLLGTDTIAAITAELT